MISEVDGVLDVDTNTISATLDRFGVWAVIGYSGDVSDGDAQQRSASAVRTSSALPGWPRERLVDSSGSTWSSNGHSDHLASAEWAAVILDGRQNIDQIRILPRRNVNDPTSSLGFPKDFVLQYAFNGSDERGSYTCDTNDPRFGALSNWKPLRSYFGYPQPASDWTTFEFESVGADCIRIFGTELSQDDYGVRYMQLADIAVYGQGRQRFTSAVSTSSTLSGWPRERLVDGTGSVWSSLGHSDHLSSSEWAAVILDGELRIDQIRILPRRNVNDASSSLGFPKDFVLQYAFNGSDERGSYTCDMSDPRFGALSNWKPLRSYFGYPQPASDWTVFNFDAVNAGCVRIFGTELSQDDFGVRYMQLADVAVYGLGSSRSVAAVSTSSTLSGWPRERLVDGRGSVWSSVGHADHLASSEWASVILDGESSINQIRILPRRNVNDASSSLGFPKDFVLQYAFDGSDERGSYTCNTGDPRFGALSNWKPLRSYFGYPQPASDWTIFNFDAVNADCIRIFGTELSQDDFGVRYMQLADIAVYGSSAAGR